MKTIAIIRRAVLMSVCGMVGGCGGAPPMDTISPAEIAVNRAIEAKAGEYAPLELRQAQEKLDAARQAMNDEEYEQAHRLAEAAQEDARLAEVKSTIPDCPGTGTRDPVYNRNVAPRGRAAGPR